MKVLYVARTFPPRVGGLETAAQELYRSLSEKTETLLDANGLPNKYLPVTAARLFGKGLWLGVTKRPDVIYIQDGVLAPVGALLKFLLRRPCVMSVHGLDVTFKSSVYKRIARFCFPRIDKIVVGSEQTQQELLTRFPSIEPGRVTYGVRDNFYDATDKIQLRLRLEEQLDMKGVTLAGRCLLVTTGRLVKRKGVAWFIDNVMPTLAKQQKVVYLVAGNGPDKELIASLVEKHKLADSVMLLGYISDEVRNLLYNVADFFIMPNIPVAGDMEGFGLVALEAASCGTPVIASGIEGITDAVADSNTGRLLEAGNSDMYLNVILDEIKKPSLKRAAVRNYVLENYSWQKAATGYIEIFEQFVP